MSSFHRSGLKPPFKAAVLADLKSARCPSLVGGVFWDKLECLGG
jgi:hypothetical protein